MNKDARSDNAFERDKPGTNARTEAEAAIEQLRQRGGIFVEAVRATRMPMALTDPNLPGNPIVFANEAFLKLSGYRMEEILGQQPHFMNGADTDPKDAARFAEAIRSDQDDIIETVQFRKDGSRFVATVLISAFKDAEGGVLNHFMSWLDVTRRVDAEVEVADLKAVQAALRASEAKYRGLFESIDDGFCTFDVIFDDAGKAVDYRFVEVNPAFERHTGLHEAVGQRMRELAPEHEEHWFEIYGDIARTGQPRSIEARGKALGNRWFEVNAFRLGEPEHSRVAAIFRDVTSRKRAEEILSESEERQALLLVLGDAMRAETDADGKIAVAARMLGQRLHASRVLYAEYDHEKGLAHIFNGWLADGAEPFPSVVKLEDFEGEVLNDLREGRLVRVDDVGRLSAESGYAAIAKLGVQALLSPPLLVDGKLKFNVSIHQQEPRHWTDDEVALVQEVSERLWAEVVRARAEEAMRDSEEQLRLIVDSALDYAIFTIDTDSIIRTWLPGAEAVFGWTSEEAEGQPVAMTFTPEDRAAGEDMKELEMARTNGSAPNVRWHVCKDGRRVFIDGHVVALRNAQGEVDGFLKIGQDTTEKHQAREHERMLHAELQHRVRNTLAVIRSIVRRTGNTAGSVEEFEQNLDGRLNSFARTQAHVTRDPEGSISLELIVRDELLAHAADGKRSVVIDGPEVRLTSKQAETLGLAIHELTSNAIRHGALASEGNRVEVGWSLAAAGDGRTLSLYWREHLADDKLAPPTRTGFGTELLERVLEYELDAQTRIEYRPDGFSYRAEIPLPPEPIR